MPEDFTGELNESRISIKIIKDVKGEVKEELPFKVLVPMEIPGKRPEEEIADRNKIKIDKYNFNDVMKSANVHLDNLVVKNTLPGDAEDLQVKLKFENMSSFNPEEIVNQVPELKRILELRKLLNDFKSRALTNKLFMKKLKEIAKDKAKLDQLIKEVTELKPKEETEAAVAADK